MTSEGGACLKMCACAVIILFGTDSVDVSCMFPLVYEYDLQPLWTIMTRDLKCRNQNVFQQ